MLRNLQIVHRIVSQNQALKLYKTQFQTLAPSKDPDEICSLRHAIEFLSQSDTNFSKQWTVLSQQRVSFRHFRVDRIVFRLLWKFYLILLQLICKASPFTVHLQIHLLMFNGHLTVKQNMLHSCILVHLRGPVCLTVKCYAIFKIFFVLNKKLLPGYLPSRFFFNAIAL